MTKKWDAGFTTNGFLAGLVAITCPCYWVSPTGAVLLGGVAGVDRDSRRRAAGMAANRRSHRRGSGARHSAESGARSRWACLRPGEFGATGPFAPDNSAPLKGLFYGGGTQVLVAQIVGSGIIVIATFAVAMVVMYAVNAIGLLRLSAEHEHYGLDLHEHGISAYPEYVISSMGRPGGMAIEPAQMSVTDPAPSLAKPHTSRL